MPLIKRGPPTAPSTPPVSVSTAKQLASGTPSERWAAARALGQDETAVALLAGALGTEQASDVREAIFTSLVLIHTSEAAAALASIIRSDDAQLRTGALDALSAVMDVARPFLPGLLSDPDPDVRLLACELARALEPSDGADLLCTMLTTEQQPNVCGAAVDVLSEIGADSVVDVLKKCAERFAEDPFLEYAIAEAIERASKRPARNE